MTQHEKNVQWLAERMQVVNGIDIDGQNKAADLLDPRYEALRVRGSNGDWWQHSDGTHMVNEDSDALLAAAAACGWGVYFARDADGSWKANLSLYHEVWYSGSGNTAREALAAALVAAEGGIR